MCKGCGKNTTQRREGDKCKKKLTKGRKKEVERTDSPLNFSQRFTLVET
jgi:hypothetical protein